MTDKIEQLERELEAARQKKATMEEKLAKLRSKADFTDQEKIELFDKLHSQVSYYLNSWVQSGREPKYGEYYIYKAVVAGCLGNAVWEVIQ